MEYEAVIGLEVHCQLNTVSKMFCGATTVFGREPNSQVDTVTLGLPGALPVINGHAVELAVKAALAVGGEVKEFSKFDRKHYFYPDLPKGYQISQFTEPYCLGGTIHIVLEDGREKDIRLTRIHMEEDAGKLIHQDDGPWSEVDLNRAGVPLIEIVSDPDLRSAQEAYAYLMELKRALKWVGVSDCEMQEGSLRCDANVSVRLPGAAFGTRVEIKNLNSFRAVEAAIEHEISQQVALNRAGRGAEIIQCTKLWDPDTKTTRIMRTKENAADYRYFPDPDLPPLVISAERVASIKATMPELPRVRELRFKEQPFALERAAANELTAEASIADYFEALVTRGCSPKLAANWTREEAMRLANEQHKPLTVAAPLDTMAELIQLVAGNKVARVVAKAECSELFASGQKPEAYFTAKGQIQVQDTAALTKFVEQAIVQEAKVVEDIKGGKLAAVGRLVGVTMKLSGGKLNPNDVKAELGKQLGVSLG